MSPNLRIAFRFLTAKKRAMLMSLSCTILGVGLFIVTQATTGGFQKFFIATILGTDGAVRITSRIQSTASSIIIGPGGSREERFTRIVEGVEDEAQIRQQVRAFPGVLGTSAVLNGNIEVQHPFKNDSGEVFGIEVEEHLRVSDLARQVVHGDVADFRDTRAGALIGSRMAERMALTLGSEITLVAQGERRSFVVKGIFSTGIEDIDKKRVYVHMGEARSLLRKPTGSTFIQISLEEPDQAPELAARLQDMLHHVVTPWQVREETWLNAFNALGMSSAITVSVFTLIAGLAMFNTLAMIVLEKTKDIAILRSMGYERGDVTSIFQWQAAIVLLIGSFTGALVGAAGTWLVSRIPLPITGIFKTDTFVVTWSPWHYVAAVATAAIMVMAASLIPARRAARLEPGDIVRGTAQ